MVLPFLVARYPPPDPKYTKTGGKLQEINPKPPQAPPEAGLGLVLHIYFFSSPPVFAYLGPDGGYQAPMGSDLHKLEFRHLVEPGQYFFVSLFETRARAPVPGNPRNGNKRPRSS